jgi:phosphate transport system substrate-binding protein
VAGDENALGYFGYAFYAENEDQLNAVALDTAGDLSACVEPNPDTIRDGSYPLSRPLYIYVNAERMQDPAVQEFVRFYLANAEELVQSIPYVPLPTEEYAAAAEKVEAAIAGEAEPDSAAAGAATPEA